MKFTTLIYFRYIPLTAKIYDDFYMKAAVEAGVKVEYWDLSPLFFPNTFGQEDSSHLLGERVIRFGSYAEIEARIRQQDISSALFLSIVTYNHLVTRLFRLLTAYGCTLGVFGRNMFPEAPPSARSLWRRLTGITPAKIRNRWNERRAMRLKVNGAVRGYDIVFQGGRQGYKGIGIVSPDELRRAQIVEVNSDDYDRYLALRDTPRGIEGEYILFLDEYLPLHPDTALFGLETISPEEYYPALNAYFDRIEALFGRPVVVAAHPKAVRYKETDYFRGRRVEFGLTGRLVRDAKFVLAHASTSISYAIAFGRPLHLITSRAIERGMEYIHRNVVEFARYIGCNWQYMDDDSPIEVAEVSAESYRRYKYDFLCSPRTEDTATQDIFINYLLNRR